MLQRKAQARIGKQGLKKGTGEWWHKCDFNRTLLCWRETGLGNKQLMSATSYLEDYDLPNPIRSKEISAFGKNVHFTLCPHTYLRILFWRLKGCLLQNYPLLPQEGHSAQHSPKHAADNGEFTVCNYKKHWSLKPERNKNVVFILLAQKKVSWAGSFF